MSVPTATKMVIKAYSDSKFTKPVGAPFTVWVNPSTYAHKTKIIYNDRQGQGSNGNSPEFNKVGEENISFELLFDATGALPEPADADYAGKGITKGIADFIALAATLNGEIHSPNYLILSWAQLQFPCVLTGLDIDYTLFRPDGTPLRAKMKVDFQSFTSEEQLAKKAKKSSPDLSHLVTVVAGDTLPLLCYDIYGDSGYYRQVAEANDLLEFRSLVPGTILLFPPLEGFS